MTFLITHFLLIVVLLLLIVIIVIIVLIVLILVLNIIILWWKNPNELLLYLLLQVNIKPTKKVRNKQGKTYQFSRHNATVKRGVKRRKESAQKK
jgi:hypothetical protein